MIKYTALDEYVNQENKKLITRSALGFQTANYLNIQTGVVNKTRLALLNSEITKVNDARTCGWEDCGNATISKREIDPAPIKIQLPYCAAEMSKYFNNNAVMVALNRALPFEEQFIADALKEVAKKNEDIVWNGVMISEVKYKGILDIITDASIEDLTAGATMYDTAMKVYNAIDSENLADTKIFMGIDKFRVLAGELTAKDLYHYDYTVNPDKFELVLPGTSTTVVGVAGLDKKNKVVALNTAHTILGVSLTADEADQQFKFYFNQNDDQYRLDIRYYLGVQVAFPDEIKWASTPA